MPTKKTPERPQPRAPRSPADLAAPAGSSDELEPGRPVPGDELTLDLHDLAHGGEAVGRHGDFVVFVPFGAPGDRVRVRVREVRRSFGRAEILEVITPSPDRVEPRCPYFGTCGGCQLQHLSAEAQIAARPRVLRDLLTRIGHVDDPVVEETEHDGAYFTRHRITLHARTPLDGGPSVLGYVSVDGDDLVPITSCVIAHDRFQPILETLQAIMPDVGEVAGEVDLRLGFPVEALQVVLGPGTENLAAPLVRELGSRHLDQGVDVLWTEEGQPRSAPRIRPRSIVLKSPWATWTLPPRVFYQVHLSLALRLAQVVREWAALGSRDRAVDLFGGVGFLATAFAGDATRVWVLEGHYGAVRAGEKAVQRAGIGNVRFVPGPVESTLPTMNFKGTLNLAVLDPPRTGVPRPVLDTLVRVGPPRILYVSCEASTLARDLAHLLAGGYRHVRSRPFELFPQTGHFESLTLLERVTRSPEHGDAAADGA